MARVGVIILAAGESTRLGKPKQLLTFRKRTLIQRAIDAALSSVCRPVVVVLGANAEAIQPKISGEVLVVQNSRWVEGMAFSIHCGLAAIDSKVDAVILMLCDQPLIESEILNNFAAKSDSGLVAAEYNGTIGVPALFGKEFFGELRALAGKQGAKQILLANEAKVVRIRCPEGAVDIDTAADYQRLQVFE